MPVKVDGQGMMEYVLIITLIAMVAMVGFQTFGTTVVGLYNAVIGALN